jgi:hypothetical protein
MFEELVVAAYLISNFNFIRHGFPRRARARFLAVIFDRTEVDVLQEAINTLEAGSEGGTRPPQEVIK